MLTELRTHILTLLAQADALRETHGDDYLELLNAITVDIARRRSSYLDTHPDHPDHDYIQRARAEHQSDGEVEIDEGAVVSHGDDPGAYVQAWVWVYDED